MPLFPRKRKPASDALSPEAQAFVDRLAPEALEVEQDALRFPGRAYLLPLSLRTDKALPGDPNSPWKGLTPEFFFAGFPMVFSLALQLLPPAEAQQQVRFRRASVEAITELLQQRLGRRPNPAEIQALQHLQEVEGALAIGFQVFRMYLLVAWFVPEEKTMLDQAERWRRALESQLAARRLTPQRLVFVADQALLHLQPGGFFQAGSPQSHVFLPEILSLLPRPFHRQPPPEDAVFLGRHLLANRDVYFSFRLGLDPKVGQATHNITLILGEQGSGKTTLARLMMVQRLLQGRAIFSLDPEGENNALAQALGGVVVPVEPPKDPETCLLHPIQGDTVEELFSAARFFLSAILGDLAREPTAVAAIHEAVRDLHSRHPRRGRFTLGELREALGMVPSEMGAALAAALSPYVRGGIWEGYFDRPRALLEPTLKAGEWRNFDLTRLGEETKDVVLTALTWYIHRVVTVGRHPMDVFIDEGWRLLRMPAFRDLLDELGRRGRKRDVGIVFITHLPREVLENPTSLALASTAFVGRLPPNLAEQLFRSFGFDQERSRQLGELTARLPRGQMLAVPVAGRGHPFPLEVVVPPAWLRRFDELAPKPREVA